MWIEYIYITVQFSFFLQSEMKALIRVFQPTVSWMSAHFNRKKLIHRNLNFILFIKNKNIQLGVVLVKFELSLTHHHMLTAIYFIQATEYLITENMLYINAKSINKTLLRKCYCTESRTQFLKYI